MTLKLLGAILVIAGCGGVGFSLCHNHRREEMALEQLIQSLAWMKLELNYRMSPLSALCRGASERTKGVVGDVFLQLALELEQQITPDVSTCMSAALSSVRNLPWKALCHFKTLGTSLGQYDLNGQMAGLEAVEALCAQDLQQMRSGREVRLRNYRVLGLCAGAAMVLLFL